MNRFLLISFFLLIISSCSQKNKGKNDLFYDNLNGNVSKVTLSYYEFKKSGHEYKEKIVYRYIFTFNHDGNIKLQTSITIPDSGASTTDQTVFSYNDKGQNIAARHLSKSKPYSKTLYDSKGNEIEILSLNEDNGTVLNKQKWGHKNDDTSELDSYLPNGDLSGKIIYISTGDHVTRLLTYDQNGKLTHQSNYIYNSSGFMIRREEKEGNKTSIFDYDYSDYDGKGNYQKSNIYYNGKNFQVEKREIEYFQKGK